MKTLTLIRVIPRFGMPVYWQVAVHGYAPLVYHQFITLNFPLLMWAVCFGRN